MAIITLDLNPLTNVTSTFGIFDTQNKKPEDSGFTLTYSELFYLKRNSSKSINASLNFRSFSLSMYCACSSASQSAGSRSMVYDNFKRFDKNELFFVLLCVQQYCSINILEYSFITCSPLYLSF